MPINTSFATQRSHRTHVNMFIKYILLCLCIIGCVLCVSRKQEADCTWEGLNGTCVKETRCMATLNAEGPKNPVCSNDNTNICCTDCQLVDDTRNAVLDPILGLLWKNGHKARDTCLQYLKELPYRCKEEGYHSEFKRILNGNKTCYNYNEWGVHGAEDRRNPNLVYPHQALLRYDDEQELNWICGGSIISEKFIVTAAHCGIVAKDKPVKYVVLNMRKLSDPPLRWQTHDVKRFIPHPDYKSPHKYNDIGLVETELTIRFDVNVLPACLHVDEHVLIKEAVSTTWFDLKSDPKHKRFADTIQTFKMEEFSEEECKSAYGIFRLLKLGYDHKTQMCFGSKTKKTNPSETCKGLSGEPLLVDRQFSSCVHTIIGITSLGKSNCGPNGSHPEVYTRVYYYVSWIESVVWA